MHPVSLYVVARPASGFISARQSTQQQAQTLFPLSLDHLHEAVMDYALIKPHERAITAQ